MNEIRIPVEDRALATLAHLSGLAGYIVPGGGIIVPIVLWMTQSHRPIIAAIARQAVLLNLVAFTLACIGVGLFFTILLIPVVVIGWIVLGLAAIGLPIYGAIKAADGVYYRYPVVGSTPDVPTVANV
mgnify:FL=1|jgi:uncharacterized Tic20 family protein